jgi:hypothetical protein
MREEMGRRAFERVRTRFSAARMVDDTLDVYRSRWHGHARSAAPVTSVGD